MNPQNLNGNLFIKRLEFMKLSIKNNKEDMAVGDIIACRYTATSGVAGFFSELGTCTVAEIPVTGTATPDGLFYFTKSDKGLLIADRVVQTGISWDALNTAGYIEGAVSKDYSMKVSPTMTSSTSPSPYVVTASNFEWYSGSWGYEGYRAFSSSYWKVNSYSIPSGGHWLKIFMGSPTRIESMLLQAYVDSWFKSSIRNWNLYGSNDDITYTLIASGLQPNLGGSTINTPYAAVRYAFTPVAYSYYKIALPDGYQATAAVGIYSIGFYNTVIGMGDNIKIRSLSGGNAYLDTDGKASLVNKNLGAYPSNNEYDKYIVNSDLNGKITPGDDNIWHWQAAPNQTSFDTPLKGLSDRGYTVIDSSYRTHRGSNKAASPINSLFVAASSLANDFCCFRPVLEYIEDSKCTNLWY
jgi:hypothetical protein